MGKQDKAPFEDFLTDPEVRAGARKVLRAAVRHLPEKDREAAIALADELAKTAAHHAQGFKDLASLFRGVARSPKTNGGAKKG